jgi:hypothetical protein
MEPMVMGVEIADPASIHESRGTTLLRPIARSRSCVPRHAADTGRHSSRSVHYLIAPRPRDTQRSPSSKSDRRAGMWSRAMWRGQLRRQDRLLL